MVQMMDLPEAVLASILGMLPTPQDLARTAVVCKPLSLLVRDSEKLWKSHYSQRWKVNRWADDAIPSWHIQYGTKMQQIKHWAGRYQVDQLHGHTKGVRCCKLLARHNLLATGSLDRTVRLWDLSAGMPLAVSKPHGGTVRCVALDSGVLASGCADHLVRVWLPNSNSTPAPSGRSFPEFNLSDAPTLTLRHTGPVAAMCLTETALYSGSWDYSVKVWDRHTWTCSSVLTYDDWVGCVAVRGPHLLVAAGPIVYVHDTCTGQVIRKFQDLHEGHVACLEGMHNGSLIFTGSLDGLVLSHDLRMRESTRVLWHHNACVQSLAYEDPWLATASADGTLVMLDTEGCMAGTGRCSSNSYGGQLLRSSIQVPHLHQFHTGGGPAYCVDLADQYLACGSESDTVRLWDFTKAGEAAARAAAAKASRQSKRANKLGSSTQDAAAPVGAGAQQPRQQRQRRQQQQAVQPAAHGDASNYNGGVNMPVPMSISPPTHSGMHYMAEPRGSIASGSGGINVLRAATGPIAAAAGPPQELNNGVAAMPGAASSSHGGSASGSGSQAAQRQPPYHAAHGHSHTRRSHQQRARHTFNPFVPCPAPMAPQAARSGQGQGMRSLPLMPGGNGGGQQAGFAYRQLAPHKPRGGPRE